MDLNKKILLVAGGPILLDHGWHIRTFQIVKHFEDAGFGIKILILYPKQWGEIPKEWLSITENIGLDSIIYYDVFKGYKPNFEIYKHIKKRVAIYDYIYFRFDHLAFKSMFYFYFNKVIIELDDFLMPELRGNVFQRIKFWTIYILIDFLANKKVILTLNDQKYFKKSIWIPVLPVNLFLKEKNIFKKEITQNPSLLFIGQDIDALVLFLSSHWKKIVEVHSNIEFKIISKNANKIPLCIRQLKGLILYTYVENLVPFYEQAWLFIHLSDHKAGVHIKILESLSYYTPVLTTFKCSRGYEIVYKNQNSKCLNVVDSEKEITYEIINNIERYNVLFEIDKTNYVKILETFDYNQISKRLLDSF